MSDVKSSTASSRLPADTSQVRATMNTTSSSEVPPPVPLWITAAPYATASAGIFAATLAAFVALRGIKASRQNLLDQLDVQRELGARASWANVVSANRQRWIDALREDLAEFVSADFVLAENADTDETADTSDPQIAKLVYDAKQKRRLMFRRIQLRLNRQKPDQDALWIALRAVMPATGSKHRAAVRELVAVSKRVLRSEWQRVKMEASGINAPTQPRQVPVDGDGSNPDPRDAELSEAD